MMALPLEPVRHGMGALVVQLQARHDGAHPRHIRLDPHRQAVIMGQVLMVQHPHGLGLAVNAARSASRQPLRQIGGRFEQHAVCAVKGFRVRQRYLRVGRNGLPIGQAFAIVQYTRFQHRLFFQPPIRRFPFVIGHDHMGAAGSLHQFAQFFLHIDSPFRRDCHFSC